MLLLTADFCVFGVDTLETFDMGDGAAVSHLDRLAELSGFCRVLSFFSLE